MKIVCENCGAKYSIADEKIKGKIFKIRCKKCNESIVIRGDAQGEMGAAPEAAAGAPPPMPAADAADDGDAETRVFDYSGYQQGGAAPGGEAVWHIVVEGNQQGPYTTAQIKEYVAGGNLDWETFIWREGFDDWKPIREVADFGAGGAAPRAAAAAPTPMAAAPAAKGGGGLFDAPASGGGLFDAPAGGGGLFDAPAGGGGLFDAPAAAAPAPAAKPAGGGLFDAKPASGGLFGGGAAAASPGDVFSSAGSAGGDGGGLFGGAGGGGSGGGGGGGLFDSAEGGGDLFGDSHEAGDGGGIFSSAGAAAPAPAGPRVSAAQAMMTGQRNENSVLFSLSNLQALASAEAPAARPGGGGGGGFTAGGEASGLIDIRSLASNIGGAEKTGVDDLISIGGGGFAPSLGAPVLAAQRTGMSTGAKIGIIGGGVAVLGLGVIAVIWMLQPEEKPTQAVDPRVAQLEAQIQALMAKGGGGSKEMADLKDQLQAQKDQTAPQATGEETAPAGDKATEDKKGEAKKGEPKKGSSGGGSGGGAKPKDDGSKGSSGGAAAAGGASAGAGGDTAPKPKKDSVSELDDLLGGSGPAPKKKEEPKAPSGGGAPAGGGGGGGGGGNLPDKLSRDQVQAGMNAVAGAVSKCGQGATGTVTVQATIAPTGRVTSATTTGSFAGTPAGLCAARAVRGARFPQTQNSLSVTYPFKF